MIRRYLLNPLLGFLRQGMSPRKLALTIAVGFALGIIPVLGSTTILCTFAALAFGLNLPAIQAVNAVVYPLQLVLLIPFLRAGSWLFGGTQPALTVSQIFDLIGSNVWQAIATLWVATLHALAVWSFFAVVASLVLYVILTPILAAFWRKASAS